jgi:GntR family transcriptional repressor for pyruvate dehydrogenase complex
VLKHANRSTLHDDVMAQMIAAIKENHWTPGSRIPGEQSLAATFGVSRTCIREVLKALAHSGVLEAHPGQGTFLSENADRILNGTQLAVTMFSDSSYTELMEIRQLLEGQAAYWATQRATPADLDRLEYILRGEERGESLNDIHDAFHNAIVEISGNRLLVKLLDSLRGEIWAQRKFHYSILPDEDRREHWKVLEAMRSKSPQKAWEAMIHHVNYFWKKQYEAEKNASVRKGRTPEE